MIHTMQTDVRFLQRVQIKDGCWLWTASRDRKGYGYFSKFKLAHRFSYLRFIGDIPKGLQIDHLCRNRACANPAHLELVTSRENWERGQAPSRIFSLRNVCSSGHAYTPENTLMSLVTKSGTWYRRCRTCQATYKKKWEQGEKRR